MSDQSMLSPSLQNPPVLKAYGIRLIAGTANRKLAEDISKWIGVPLLEADISTFADGETKIQIKGDVRGTDAFIIQPMSPPHVNDNLVELLLLINTLRLSSVKRVTVVCPYYGYARQDQKVQARVPISASAVARLMCSMEPHRLVTIDLHCGQIQGFFPPSIPVDNLFAENVLISYLLKNWGKHFPTVKSRDIVIVSPDAGGVSRANRIAEKLQSSGVVTALKRRVEANKVESMEMVGDVRDKVCIIVDDMADTCGTLCKCVELLKENGASEVFACITHGVFSRNAMEKIENSSLTKLFITDTISQEKNMRSITKLQVVSVATLLSKAIKRIHNEQSLSDLFNDWKY